MKDLTEEFLLRSVMAWYAREDNWVPKGPPGPYAHIGRSKGVAADGGQKAREALAAKSIGELFRVVCDVLDLPVTEISRRSGVPMSRIADIVSGSEIPQAESMALRAGMESVIGGARG